MKIIEKEALTVIGIPVKAKWQELWRDMPVAWREFFSRHTEIEYRYGDAFVDISLDKVGDEYLQLICTEVSRVKRIPDGMRAIEIPAQSYIYHRHVGPVTGIAESFGKMYDWAHDSEHTAGEFKIDVGYTAEGDESEHDLYIGLLPVKEWRDVEAV